MTNLQNKRSDIKRQTCFREVKISNCQRSKSRVEYWKNRFAEIELETATPHHLRKEYLQTLLPSKLYDAVANCLHFKHDYTATCNPCTPSFNYEEPIDDPSKKSSTELVSEDLITSAIHVEKKKPKADTLNKCNPYINFLRKSPEDANTWLPKKPPDFRIKPLVEKSEIITHNIISDFVEWLNELGQISSDILLNEDTLQNMFRIGTNTFAQKAMCIQMTEIAAVPEEIAVTYNNSKKSSRNILRRILSADLKAENRKFKNFAFGTSLPQETMKFAPNNKTFDRWIKCSHVPRELKTMEQVFKGITDIYSVKAYCHWLIKNPSLPRPQYLIDNGLLEHSYWDHCTSIATSELGDLIERTLHKEFGPKSSHNLQPEMSAVEIE